MATGISAVYSSAMASQLAFHPAVEPQHRIAPLPAQAEEHSSKLGSEDLKHAVEQMNALTSIMNHRLSFSVDQETHDIIVKVVDAETEKVIRELPPAELEKLHKSLKEALGHLIDKLI